MSSPPVFHQALIQALIGWLSSAILFATLCRQVYKQWKEHTSRGVSKWLFIGQLASEMGFIAYSWMVRNWVFVVTNALILVTNVVGLLILLRHRRESARHAARGRRLDAA
jgi:hypothetical protein